MNLRQFVKYWLWRDATHRGEFAAMRRLMTPDFPRVVVDVGANDGFYGSNSFLFVARGWRAILIEPHLKVFTQSAMLTGSGYRQQMQISGNSIWSSTRIGKPN